ncbi:Protein detoxification 56 [Vitis vinifera]|uniref:Protein detoxification 56 n=1 Tax=Vitis vinifera TaxID=29760 RepID=A0A438ESR7_VITVI|nr:Protein detoxification 56 [Vitis vinifera]
MVTSLSFFVNGDMDEFFRWRSCLTCPHLPSHTNDAIRAEEAERNCGSLMVMNLAWLGKCVITTVFLGQLGELQLAGGVLGFTFANVTGYSVLNGLCCAMEPICGQACGAKNVRLLHKTLVMVTILLLTTAVPISFLWLNVDKILIYFGQQEDISMVAKTYLLYLLPDLFVISLLCPLKTYLSAQSMVFPIMFSTSVALAFHVPINILLSRAKGLKGVSMAGWVTDLLIVILLAFYVLRIESSKERRWKEGGWWDQGVGDWIKMLKLCGPSCLTTCLEWWCYEILVLLAGRLPNAKQARYLGYLYSHDARTIRGVKKMLPLMAPVEVVNFPLAVCGGIVRGTARMSLAMYANLGGFYLVALPLGVVFAFKAGLGLGGLLIGLLVGVVVCLALLLVFIFRIDWAEAAGKAQILACREQEIAKEDENHRILKTLENP